MAPKSKKITPKLSQNQKLELKKTYKIKVVRKIAQKVKDEPKIKSKS